MSIKLQINEEVWAVKIINGVINMLQNKSTLRISNAVGWNYNFNGKLKLRVSIFGMPCI